MFSRLLYETRRWRLCSLVTVARLYQLLHFLPHETWRNIEYIVCSNLNAVCGQHTDAISLQHSKRWSLQAYDIWSAIAADPELSAASGVEMRNSNFFFRRPIEVA